MILSKKLIGIFNVFLFLIFISNMLVIITSRTESEGIRCIDREREALLKFKTELDDVYDRLSTWGSEAHKQDCCKWKGIRCHNRTNHVVSLDLQGPVDDDGFPFQPLLGNINSSLLELSYITYLDLSNNWFNTAIPKFIGSFKNLQHLSLGDSGFIGSIPPHLGNLSMLRVLDLGGNFGTSSVDLDWLLGFHSLQHLDLSYVDVSEVTKPINKLTQLKKLNLSSCRIQDSFLTSSFPVVGNESTKSLMVLDLSSNNLTMSTFLWFLNFSSNYSYIDFSFNNLDGKIPDALTNLMSVSHLDLSNSKLEGSIPDTLGNMTSLAYLDLSGNQLEGNIPDGIGKLMSISYLDLSRNNLQGGFPRSPGNLSKLVSLKMSENKLEGDLTYMNEFLRASTMLEYLHLSSNRFYGSIPKLSRFPSLNMLNLWSNQLNGSFTDLKLRLPHLTILDVAENRLTGRLPNLASCSSLAHLRLSGNGFNGTLTETIGYLSKLQELDISSNNFGGVISETHLFNMSTLQFLDLSFNSNLTIRISSDCCPPFQLIKLNLVNCTIGPSFPKWMQNQAGMDYLDISNSQIYDLVPRWFWENSRSLRYLNMSFNHMYGVIPDLALSTQSLDLRSNEFNGSLPHHSSSSEIYMSTNKFSGDINGFCNNTYQLYVLDLSDNRLSGELSKECFMNLMTHKYLYLGNNNFSGEIPKQNSSSCALKALHLRNNSFRGHFPVSIRDCHDLDIIDLGNNYFTGEIPTWIGESFSQMTIVSLRSNEFSGSLPSTLCFLANIEILDISLNDISGTIPRCLDNFTSLSTKPTSSEYHINNFSHLMHGGFSNIFYFSDTANIMWKGHEAEFGRTLWMVKAIDLSNNRFVGEIPNEITHLEGVLSLDLSRNHLKGSIPRGIDKLEFLNFLDLSENNLSGNIPTTLSGLDQLGLMNLSFNNLSGKIPWNGHLETFGSNAFSGNPQLCGPPLLRLCPGDQVPHIPKPTIHSDSEDDLDTYITIWFYVSIGFILAFWGTFGTLNFNRSCRIKFSKLLMALDDWWYVNKRTLQRYFQTDETNV